MSKDNGTPELARRFTVVPKLTEYNNWSVKVMDETEIDRLLLQGVITPNQHSSLEGFMRRLHKVGFVGLKSPDYSSPISADPAKVGDRKAMAIRGVVKLTARLDKKIGPAKRRALVNLVLLDAPWKGDDLIECIRFLDDAIQGR